MIAGVNPHRELDDGYQTFFELAAAQVVTAIHNARGHEEARLRGEKLAELDRAKTAFFSNVSHEFRTPLTLILGTTEDALSKDGLGLARDGLDTVHRNDLASSTAGLGGEGAGGDRPRACGDRADPRLVAHAVHAGAVFPELPPDSSLFQMFRGVFASGESFTAEEFCVPLDRAGSGVIEDGFFKFTSQPVRDASATARTSSSRPLPMS